MQRSSFYNIFYSSLGWLMSTAPSSSLRPGATRAKRGVASRSPKVKFTVVRLEAGFL